MYDLPYNMLKSGPVDAAAAATGMGLYGAYKLASTKFGKAAAAGMILDKVYRMQDKLSKFVFLKKCIYLHLLGHLRRRN